MVDRDEYYSRSDPEQIIAVGHKQNLLPLETETTLTTLKAWQKIKSYLKAPPKEGRSLLDVVSTLHLS